MRKIQLCVLDDIQIKDHAAIANLENSPWNNDGRQIWDW